MTKSKTTMKTEASVATTEHHQQILQVGKGKREDVALNLKMAREGV